RELDEVYRRFVVLADRIKNVEDHHLLQLIRDTKDQAVRMPPAHVETNPGYRLFGDRGHEPTAGRETVSRASACRAPGWEASPPSHGGASLRRRLFVGSLAVGTG